MEATSRREKILQLLKLSPKPITGNYLAKELCVSRQVIVQDIAIIRASGEGVLATPQGYMIPFRHESNSYKGKLACVHDFKEMEKELSTIVALGGKVIDVEIEHPIYGELTGLLMVSSLKDVADFMQKINNTKAQPLSTLTGGVHLHTIETKSKDDFEEIRKALQSKNLLVQ